MLEGVYETLQWQGDLEPALAHAERRYASLLARSAGELLGSLDAESSPWADTLGTMLAAAAPPRIERLLLDPEVARQLLWRPVEHPLESTRESAEAAARAIVDACNGNCAMATPGAGGLVLDLHSPAAMRIDSARAGISTQLRPYADAAEEHAAIGRTGAAMAAVDAVDPAIAAFVRRFTRVANLVTDEAGQRFSSGSMNQFTGRSIFWNAHLPSVTVAMLAEALVHEAIHAWLYMHEAVDAWFDGDVSVAAPEQRFESPWTGAKLKLEPFVQAPFVWFGLAGLWAAADRSAVFDRATVQRHAATARNGFLRGPLVPRLDGAGSGIAPGVLAVVEAMQAHIVAAADDAGLDTTAGNVAVPFAPPIAQRA